MFAASACSWLVRPAVSRTRAVRRSWRRTAWSSDDVEPVADRRGEAVAVLRRDEAVAVERDPDGLTLGCGQHEDRALVGAHHSDCLSVSTTRR